MEFPQISEFSWAKSLTFFVLFLLLVWVCLHSYNSPYSYSLSVMNKNSHYVA